jgi:hypothetical protein
VGFLGRIRECEEIDYHGFPFQLGKAMERVTCKSSDVAALEDVVEIERESKDVSFVALRS